MPVPKELIHEGYFTIRTSEIGPDKTVTVSALINLMQEAAMQNVIELKVSIWDMESNNISWVLMRKNLRIHRLPILGEAIKIVTHPAGFDKVFTYRDYKVYDKNGTLIAESASTWLLMNTKSRRIARIPEEIRQRGIFDTSKCLAHAKSKLKTVQSPSVIKEFYVNWHDLDFNQHLNNVRYMQWIFETVDYYTTQTNKLKELDIVYKSECYWKDTVQVRTQQLSISHFLHQLVRLSDNEVLANAQTFWE